MNTMTVGELVEKLGKFDPAMPVLLDAVPDPDGTRMELREMLGEVDSDGYNLTGPMIGDIVDVVMETLEAIHQTPSRLVGTRLNTRNRTTLVLKGVYELDQ